MMENYIPKTIHPAVLDWIGNTLCLKCAYFIRINRGF
jgi:hypothetical protein